MARLEAMQVAPHMVPSFESDLRSFDAAKNASRRILPTQPFLAFPSLLRLVRRSAARRVKSTALGHRAHAEPAAKGDANDGDKPCRNNQIFLTKASCSKSRKQLLRRAVRAPSRVLRLVSIGVHIGNTLMDFQLILAAKFMLRTAVCCWGTKQKSGFPFFGWRIRRAPPSAQLLVASLRVSFAAEARRDTLGATAARK